MNLAPAKYISEEPCATFECDVNSPPHNISFESDMTTYKTQTCIYCDQKTKRHKLKRLPLHKCDKNLFLNKLNEEKEDMADLIEKVQDVTDSIIYYHKKCQLEYSYKISSKNNTVKTSWHDLRQHHQAVFDEVCNFIQQNVVEKGRCNFLTYLHRQYMELFNEEIENCKEDMGNFTPHNLEDKINKVFTKEIKFLLCHNKKLLDSTKNGRLAT